VINVDALPLHFDAEMPVMIHEAMRRMNVSGVVQHISNRKILEGYLRGLEFPDYAAAIRWLDKIDKITPDILRSELTMLLEGMPPAEAVKRAETAMALAKIKTSDISFVDKVKALGVSHPLLDEGLNELAFVMERLKYLPEGSALADLSIARGFDYYTGTVFEGKLANLPGTGSVVAGGRYEDLAGAYINKKLPGVGISLGLTRLFSLLHTAGQIAPGPRSPAAVLIVLWSEELRAATEAIATTLRGRGIKVEMYHAPQKLSRQLSYAERKNIPYVWFLPQEEGAPHEVKALATGKQVQADAGSWTV
jgi:histidyl-tRNA synthetase